MVNIQLQYLVLYRFAVLNPLSEATDCPSKISLLAAMLTACGIETGLYRNNSAIR